MHIRITYKASQIWQVYDLWLRRYVQKHALSLNASTSEFFCFKVSFFETFFMCSQLNFQTYYELTQIVRQTHFIWKISKVQLLPLQTNKNFLLSNFRIFPYKMDVFDNLGQFIIWLETWLETHEKSFNKRNLKIKKFLAAGCCGCNSWPRQDNDLMNCGQKNMSSDQGHGYQEKARLELITKSRNKTWVQLVLTRVRDNVPRFSIYILNIYSTLFAAQASLRRWLEVQVT
jgi:hypothetical protein